LNLVFFGTHHIKKELGMRNSTVGAGSVRVGYNNEGVEVYVGPDDRVIKLEDFPQFEGNRPPWEIVVDHIVNNNLEPPPPRKTTKSRTFQTAFWDAIASQLIEKSFCLPNETPPQDSIIKNACRKNVRFPKKAINFNGPCKKKEEEFFASASATATEVNFYKDRGTYRFVNPYMEPAGIEAN
jgi:hypothetical protein